MRKPLYEPSREAAARIVAKHLGLEGRSGGWLYNKRGKPVLQGYLTLANSLDRAGEFQGRGKAIVPKQVPGRNGETVTRWAINWRAFDKARSRYQ